MPVRLRRGIDTSSEQQIIPMSKEFFVYRRSDVELTEDDRPTGLTYRPYPNPQPKIIGVQPEVRATHLIIRGLSNDCQISHRRLHPSEVDGNPNHAVWECMCNCPIAMGKVTNGNWRKCE